MAIPQSATDAEATTDRSLVQSAYGAYIQRGQRDERQQQHGGDDQQRLHRQRRGGREPANAVHPVLDRLPSGRGRLPLC